MKNKIGSGLILTFFLILSSCSKDLPAEVDDSCDGIEVYYGSTAVCAPEGAAAISFDQNGSYLTILNFSDFLDPNTLNFEDTLIIKYDQAAVDSSALFSGILCGPLIVAPVVEVECLEKI